MLKKKWLWGIVLIYTFLIFNNSLKPADASNNMSGPLTLFIMRFLSTLHIETSFHTMHHIIRKLAHFSEFFLLSVLVQIASYYQPVTEKRWLPILVFMLAVPTCDEFLQLFMEGRAGSLHDVLLDMSGYGTAWLCGYVLQRRKN